MSTIQHTHQGQADLTFQITTYYVVDPPEGGRETPWLAIATAHIYDPDPNPGLLSPEAAVLAGAVMKVLHGRGTAGNQEAAVRAALAVLFIQVDAYKKARLSTTDHDDQPDDPAQPEGRTIR